MDSEKPLKTERCNKKLCRGISQVSNLHTDCKIHVCIGQNPRYKQSAKKQETGEREAGEHSLCFGIIWFPEHTSCLF